MKFSRRDLGLMIGALLRAEDWTNDSMRGCRGVERARERRLKRRYVLLLQRLQNELKARGREPQTP